jgi:predicted amidohydrolase
LKSEAHFTAGTEQPVFSINDTKFGINICYDSQFSNAASMMVANGAKIILCPSNNMLPALAAEKYRDLHNPCRAERAIEHQCWYISSDVTGERDGQVSYGPTAAINPHGELVAQIPLGETGMICVDI